MLSFLEDSASQLSIIDFFSIFSKFGEKRAMHCIILMHFFHWVIKENIGFRKGKGLSFTWGGFFKVSQWRKYITLSMQLNSLLVLL